MWTVCFGGVCVPMHLLLPFLIGLLHKYGWFKFVKEEWFTLFHPCRVPFWKLQYTRWTEGSPDEPSSKKPGHESASSTTHEKAKKDLKNDVKSLNKSVDAAVQQGKDDSDLRHRKEKDIHTKVDRPAA